MEDRLHARLEAPSRPRGLAFGRRRLELGFRRQYADAVLPQSRVALLVGAFTYLVLGLEDRWFFGDEALAVIALRGCVAALLLLVLASTWTRFFRRHHQAVLVGTALVGGLGALAMIALGNDAVQRSYYFGVALVIFWAYTFSGLRFWPALTVNALLLLAYAATVVIFRNAAWPVLIPTLLRLGAASVLAGVAGYMLEWQRRALYRQAVELALERRRQARRARRDRLTGLPNRTALEERLDLAVARARRNGTAFAVLFVDINDFKPVNDRYGHAVGDAALRVLAGRLAQCVRANDLVARFGGDEFVVLVEDIGDGAGLEELAAKLQGAVAEPVGAGEAGARRALQLGASIGIARWPEDAVEPALLVQRADVAMYRAKTSGESWRQYGGDGRVRRVGR